MTNREWINTLTNKECVYLFASACNVCIYKDKDCAEHAGMNCYEGCLKWLEKEHEDGENDKLDIEQINKFFNERIMNEGI